jgi:CheY-like chemotaxis protein
MPKKILLADDSITIQKVVELTFSDGDYEVSAVNNGAKAIQKLSEMRPDIILSDIIMPEKNGYEVCEYVKSHPEYRNIPVVLLTGTFEPFDPDRAEKAGCDAVVTKPFESQSLIHKVEELIAQARSAINATAVVPIPTMPAAPPPPPPEPEPAPSPWAAAPSPWMEETTPTAPPTESSPFTTSGGSFPLPPMDSFTHNPDIFGSASTPEPTTEMPFDTPAESPFSAPAPAEEFSGETRAFPRMSFEEMQQMAAPQAPAEPEPEPEPPVYEPSPWDEPAAPAVSPFAAEPEYSAETRAFTKMSFDDIPPLATPSPAASEPEPESPFGAPPPAEEFSGETRAFPRMSFEELQQMAAPQALPAELEPPPVEASPWDEPAAPELQAEPSPWGEPEPAAFGGETRAFPKMSFEDLQQQMSTPAPEPEPEPESQPMAWEQTESVDILSSYSISGGAGDLPVENFEEQSASAVPEDMPFAEPEPEESLWAPAGETPSAGMEAEPAFEEPPPPPPISEAPPMEIARGNESSGDLTQNLPHDLTDDQVDRIARRVIELMSDNVVRNIAWEVIPDLAEMVVKERIRQLESEA